MMKITIKKVRKIKKRKKLAKKNCYRVFSTEKNPTKKRKLNQINTKTDSLRRNEIWLYHHGGK
jgi:hypothetical protein